MRYFCGWDARQAEAVETFRYSVETNAYWPATPIDVEMLDIDDLPITRRGPTGFTYARFLIPHLCGYEGRAAFFDGADMLCLGDVQELATVDMGGRPLMVVKNTGRGDRPRVWTSVMLMDCAQLECWSVETVQNAADERLMRLRDLADDQIGALDLRWNVLVEPGDVEPEGAKILHWSALADPNGNSWVDRSRSALWAGWRDRARAEQVAA